MASNTVIRTNVLALNSHRNLGLVGVQKERSSQRLSSGYRINSAADDAAGLAISEKMRAQIRGLDMANKNTQDGISLIQTAEGGMQEIDNMLQRIRELVVYASTDTNDQDNSKMAQGDRQKIQDEIVQLVQEIDSMADRVEFNSKKLINGSWQKGGQYDSYLDNIQAKYGAGSSSAAAHAVKLNAVFASQDWRDLAAANASDFAANGSVGSLLDAVLAKNATQDEMDALIDAVAALTSDVSGAQGRIDTELKAIDMPASGSDYVLTISTSGNGANVGASYAAVVAALQAANIQHSDGSDWQTASKSIWDDVMDAGAKTAFEAVFAAKSANDMQEAWDAFVVSLEGKFNTLTSTDKTDTNKLNAAQANMDTVWNDIETLMNAALSDQLAAHKTANPSKGGDNDTLYFQIGANSEQGIYVNINGINSKHLGLGSGNTHTVKGTPDVVGADGGTGVYIDVREETGAEINALIKGLDAALTRVTTERSKLGAIQNRLEYTGNSLQISSENLSAAESRVRNTDMGREMMSLTQANILQQAAISMLAQGNMQPQSILQLLQ